MQLTVTALLAGSAAAFSIQGPAHLMQRRSIAMPRSCGVSLQADTATGPLAADMKVPSVKVQGNTLKTWDLGDEGTQRVQLKITSGGRPVDANIELWHTPSYIPTKFRVYTEDGIVRPVDAIIETPKHPKTVAVYNTGSIDFPFDATVANTGLASAYECIGNGESELVQGGRITSYAFGAEVDSVQILLKSDERNMKAKIELTQGPNQVKQIIEVYASVGYKNPFYCVIQTPGSANAIRVINQNTVEFPFNAWVLPFETGAGNDSEPVMGGGGF